MDLFLLNYRNKVMDLFLLYPRNEIIDLFLLYPRNKITDWSLSTVCVSKTWTFLESLVEGNRAINLSLIWLNMKP